MADDDRNELEKAADELEQNAGAVDLSSADAPSNPALEGYHEVAPWNGHARYECDHEDFVTTRLDLMVEHVKQHLPKRRLSDVLGPKGERVEVETRRAVHTPATSSGNTGTTEPASGDEPRSDAQ